MRLSIAIDIRKSAFSQRKLSSGILQKPTEFRYRLVLIAIVVLTSLHLRKDIANLLINFYPLLMDSMLNLLFGTKPEAMNSFIYVALIVLLFGSFIRVFTALNILRFGLGLRDFGFGLVVLVFAFGLSTYVLQRDLGEENFTQLVKLDDSGVDKILKPYLEKNTDSAIFERLSKASLKADSKQEANKNFSLLLCSFIVSELRVAFKLGLLFILPFFVVDLLITNIMMGLGINQLSHQVVALPLKILLFVVIDGWGLVVAKLLGA